MRHRKSLAAVRRDVGIPQVIGEDHEDVGLLPHRVGGVQRGQRREQEGGEEGEGGAHPVKIAGPDGRGRIKA